MDVNEELKISFCNKNVCENARKKIGGWGGGGRVGGVRADVNEELKFL